MLNLEGPAKFTALESAKIAEILRNAPELSELAIIIGPEIIKKSDEIAEIKADLVKNYKKVIQFLHKLGLVGKDSDMGRDVQHGNYNINADALCVINAYYRQKNDQSHNCNVEVVRYYDADFPDFYDSFVNKALVEAVNRDFVRLSKEDEFSKSYLAVAGLYGEHVYVVSIKKERGSVEPVVELFDTSPKLVRGGLDLAQNMVKWGTAEQLVAPVSISKAFEGTVFALKNENYFHNLEPFQTSGPSYCGTYSLEHAYEVERQGVRDRIEYLRSVYRHDSIYGGMAELGISYEDAKKEFLERSRDAKPLGSDLPKTFQGVTATMSHFGGFYDNSEERRGFLSSVTHERKSGDFETLDQRRDRYMVDRDIGGKNKVVNEMVQEKSMRQRLHLFEIVVSQEFQDFALTAQEELAGQPLSRGGNMTKGILNDRIRAYEGGTSESFTQDPDLEKYRALFRESCGLPYKLEYDKENDCVEVSIRYIDTEYKKFEDFKKLLSKNGFLKENFIYKEEFRRIDGNFGELKVHDSLRQRFEVGAVIKNCREFFRVLKEEKSKPSVDLEVKSGTSVASHDSSRKK